jgi:hypothetical protein
MVLQSERITAALPVLGLMLLMLATRFHHFGSSIYLPDASLAVFFLAGLYLSWRWFPVLILLAGGIDLAATSWAGVSDFCITPAYIFLLPTYASLTLGGMWARRFLKFGSNDILMMTLTAFAATSIAFVISNGSFYFFSGYFASMSFADYIARTIGYYVPYLGWALFYIAAALSLVKLARIVLTDRAVSA